MIVNLNQNQIFDQLGALGSGGGGSPPLTPNGIDISPDSLGGGSVVVVWDNPDLPDTNEIFKSTDGINYAAYDSVAGNLEEYVDPAAFGAGDTWFYKVRACNGSGCSALTAARGIANQYVAATVPAAAQDLLVFTIGGAIDCSAGGLGDQSFALLRQCDGFSGASSDITGLSVPSLTNSAGNIDFSSCFSLTAVDISVLAGVSGSLMFPFCPILDSISAPLLVSVNELNFEDDFALASASFPSVAGAMGTINFEQTAVMSFTIGASSISEVLFGGSAIQSVSFPSATSIGVNLDFSGTALTSLSAPVLVMIGGSFFIGGTSLASLSIPFLEAIGGAFDFSDCAGLVTVSVPALVTVGDFLTSGNTPNLTTIDFTDLQSIGSTLNINNSGITAANFPALDNVGGGVLLNANGALVSISMPVLTSISSDWDCSLCASLTTVNIGPCSFPSSVLMYNCTLLTSLTFAPGTTWVDGADFLFTNCALDVGVSADGTGVDGALRLGVNAAFSAATLDLSGGTNATPDAPGQVDKAILQGNGASVLTN